MKPLRLIAAIALAWPFSAPADEAGFDAAIAALQAGDLGLGAALFRDLAQAGDGDAMYNLALLFHQGLGLPQSREEALFWAWMARLYAVEKAPKLIDVLSVELPKDLRAKLHERLVAKVQETAMEDAPLSFIRLALIEESLAAKPNRPQIYAWYSQAVAMGHLSARANRDAAFAALKPKEQPVAEALAIEGFTKWCGSAGAGKPVCAGMS